MRELDRNMTPHPPLSDAAPPRSIGVIGRGRLGPALAAALAAAGFEVDGPAGRGEIPRGEAIILCVPDREIEAAAASVAGAAPLVGHTSGATALAALAPAAQAGAAVFGLHPLQTFPAGPPPADPLAPFAGAGCAVAGSDPAAAGAATALARALGMRPFAIDDGARAAYHAAASAASNYTVTLLGSAERIAAAAGIGPEDARALLAPLVRRTVGSWEAQGPARALTGPLARGDEATAARQRAAVAEAAPELLELWDALADATRALARAAAPAAAGAAA